MVRVARKSGASAEQVRRLATSNPCAEKIHDIVPRTGEEGSMKTRVAFYGTFSLFLLFSWVLCVCSAVYAHDSEQPIDPAEIPGFLTRLKSFEPEVRATSVHHLGLIKSADEVKPI